MFVSVAGMSGPYEPIWPTVLGHAVQDGYITWILSSQLPMAPLIEVMVPKIEISEISSPYEPPLIEEREV